VRLGVAGLDSNVPPSLSANTAPRFTYVRHGHQVGPLATLPAHRG
jgi:hypothetical protein